MTIRDYGDFTEPLPHPGELLREDYLPAYGLTPGALARAMRLKDRTRIERLVREAQPVSADTGGLLDRPSNGPRSVQGRDRKPREPRPNSTY
jgi:hypothetical protein